MLRVMDSGIAPSARPGMTARAVNCPEFGVIRLGLKESFILKRLFTRALLTPRLSCCVRVGNPMRCVDEPGRSLRFMRIAALATISVAAVSCSSDTARFSSNPFRSQPASNEATGSVKPQKHAAIQSQPLPPPTASAPGTRPVVTGTAGGSKGMASYDPSAPRSDVTGSVAAKPGWSWQGGTAITVQNGDTIDSLVSRYGVPASAIAEANNIPNGTALRPGQRLVIPKYEVTGSTTPRTVS